MSLSMGQSLRLRLWPTDGDIFANDGGSGTSRRQCILRHMDNDIVLEIAPFTDRHGIHIP